MTFHSKPDAPSDAPPFDGAKTRQCLRCSTSFQSSWSGERVCTRCKSSNAWRNGGPMRVFPSGRNR